MPLWAVAFMGVIIGAALGLISRWIETRHDKEVDIKRSVVISTAEYRELLLAALMLKGRQEEES